MRKGNEKASKDVINRTRAAVVVVAGYWKIGCKMC